MAGLASQVSVTTDNTVGVVQIGVNEPTRAEAVKRVNAVGGQPANYLENQIEQRCPRQVAREDAQIRAPRSQIAKLQQRARSAITQAAVSALETQYESGASQYGQLQGKPSKTDLTVLQPPVADLCAAPAVGAPGMSRAAGATTPATVTAAVVSPSEIPRARVARGLPGGGVGMLVGVALILDRSVTRPYRPAEMEDAIGPPLPAELCSGGGEDPVAAVAPLSGASERCHLLQGGPAADAGTAGPLFRVVDGLVAGLAALNSDRCSDAAKPTRAGSQGRRTPAGSRSSPAGALRAPGPPVAVDGVASATTPCTNGAPTALVVESEGAGEPEDPSS